MKIIIEISKEIKEKIDAGRYSNVVEVYEAIKAGTVISGEENEDDIT